MRVLQKAMRRDMDAMHEQLEAYHKEGCRSKVSSTLQHCLSNQTRARRDKEVKLTERIARLEGATNFKQIYGPYKVPRRTNLDNAELVSLGGWISNQRQRRNKIEDSILKGI